MKKFLKWSAAFLVLGVLAVGCIKNEPSEGIEAMRNAKAALLNANAALVQAKVQVEAAQAALIQAQASLLKAEEAIVAAQADKIKAEAAFIDAQTAWELGTLDMTEQEFAIYLQELQVDLDLMRAQAEKRMAQWELDIANLQDDMVQAMMDYEAKLLEFEKWKIDNAGVLAQALIDALDELTDDIKAVIRKLGRKQVQLNIAKAQYQWYVNVEYPESVEAILLHMELTKERLTCEVDYLTGIVEAYKAIYDTYHEDFDAIMAGYQEEINDIRITIAELEKSLFTLKDELKALIDERDALLAAYDVPYEHSIPDVFSDGLNDTDINVWFGDYYLADTKYEFMMALNQDIRVIEDTRHHFEDMDSGEKNARKEELLKAATDAEKAYKDAWNAWQANYKNLLPTGSLYTTWYDAWEEYDADKKAFDAHAKYYKEMYDEAKKQIDLYMYYLDGIITVDEGLVVLPGGDYLSQVLGGIYFDAGNLADFVFGSNGQAIIDLINVITVMLDVPAQMDAIVTNLKDIMDGTHGKGWPAFWDHATDWSLKATPAWNDVMREVYANSDREITDMSKEEWSTWMFLYWLFESRTVEIGLEGSGTVVTINKRNYDDAAAQVLADFFGLTPAQYTLKMKGNDGAAVITAIGKYYDAVELLTAKEALMLSPFNRTWYVAKGTDTDFTETEALAAFDKEPKIEIWHDPKSYTPPTTTRTWNPDPSLEIWTPIPDYEDEYLYDINNDQPANANEFFFVLEGADNAGRTELYPSLVLEGQPTYMDSWYCGIWADYSILKDAGNKCGVDFSTWTGDIPLWLWKDRGSYLTNGHYFRAIYTRHAYDDFMITWNRVDNGEYEALYDALMEVWTSLLQEYNELVSALNHYNNVLIPNKQAEIAALSGQIDSWEKEILYYEDLIALAWDAHNQGNMADEGLLLAWRGAEADLLEVQQELRRIEENIALYEADYGVISWWGGFIADETAIYQARIDAILEDIANLQQQLIALENIRSGLIENYQ
ncbi:MAG: hypothetical protein PHX11_08195 [Bacteroidales bacterium]|nr:hypothetical protein [Bacteroidales bacterium]